MSKSAAKQGRKANRRGAARLAAVQALYQMDIAATPLNDILAEFESHWLGREVDGSTYLPAEAAFFREIVGGFVREQRIGDIVVEPRLHDENARAGKIARFALVRSARLGHSSLRKNSHRMG